MFQLKAFGFSGIFVMYSAIRQLAMRTKIQTFGPLHGIFPREIVHIPHIAASSYRTKWTYSAGTHQGTCMQRHDAAAFAAEDGQMPQYHHDPGQNQQESTIQTAKPTQY